LPVGALVSRSSTRPTKLPDAQGGVSVRASIPDRLGLPAPN